MSTNTYKRDKEESIGYLKELLPEGSRVYCILTHVSKSGMSRSIQTVIPTKHDDETLGIIDISYLVGDAIGLKVDQKNGGLKISGCGMDVCFYIVYRLSQAIFGNENNDGYKLKKELF